MKIKLKRLPEFKFIGLEKGAANGYVCLEKGHKYYELPYDALHHIKIHGGLTYSAQEGEYWVIGFDTCHWGDNSSNWPYHRVLMETLKLYYQCK